MSHSSFGAMCAHLLARGDDMVLPHCACCAGGCCALVGGGWLFCMVVGDGGGQGGH